MGDFCSSLTLVAFTGVGPVPSAACLSAWATDSRWQLPQNQRGKKGLLQEKTKQKAHCPALAVCCCWQGHIVDQWQNSAMRASLFSPRLGKQRALSLCAAFTARKEPGGFLNDRIDTSLNYRCEQSVTSEPLYNLTAHTMPQYCR